MIRQWRTDSPQWRFTGGGFSFLVYLIWAGKSCCCLPWMIWNLLFFFFPLVEDLILEPIFIFSSMNECCRTKLKQTEVDREVLQRCCETLTEENRRLLKELQELRAIKVAAPCVIAHDYYMPLPAATLTMCPSCERVATVDNRSVTFSKPGYSHFSQSPAACWGKRENSVPQHWWFFQGILLHSPRRSSRICVTLWSRQRQEGLKM